MNVTTLAEQLPEAPRDGMKEWILDKFFRNELGGDFCIFNRTSIEVENVWNQRTISQKDSYKIGNSGNKHVAECLCTSCTTRFYTGWQKDHPSNRYGIKMFYGDDGMNYDGYISEDECYNSDFMDYSEGEEIICPYCGTHIQLVHKSKLRYGRTYQLLIVSVEVVDGYTAIVTWLAKRTQTVNHFDFDILPREALVIDGRSLYRFSHVSFGMTGESYQNKWTAKTYRGEDLSFRKYYDYASICSKKVMGVTYPVVPELAGTSGEKTGLEEYITGIDPDYNAFPFGYIRLWKKYPNIENIIKSKWRKIADSEIERCACEENYNCDLYYEIHSMVINFNEKKPHRMLGISKEDFRLELEWDWPILAAYHTQIDFVDYMSAFDFDDYVTEFGGTDGVNLCLEMTLDGYENFELEKVSKYLWKQYEKFNLDHANGITTLIDYRESLYEINRQNAGHITTEEFFPTNLVAAHDRLVGMKQALEDEKTNEKFKAIADKYNELAYNDGDLCIRVAKSNSELVNEGQTLRHCVGSYGNKHCDERDVIFFVRRYRRPERSYYTLDIRFSEGLPREIQLHGYGNERHGSYKQHSHSIPKKVRDFCDKWKQEVLKPFYLKQLNNKTEEVA